MKFTRTCDLDDELHSIDLILQMSTSKIKFPWTDKTIVGRHVLEHLIFYGEVEDGDKCYVELLIEI